MPFKIYNASAGSGKTFTLVKEYLSQILQSKTDSYYQHLLAITFTNKAVAEMKQRILENLIAFSETKALTEPPAMLLQLSKELDRSVSDIHEQSKKIVKHLLHHYASFSVETIDRFNHRLIRTFARDLKLSSSFEVTLDTSQMLAEAVDQLISKAGEDPKITRTLLDFALEKTDDDKSWDISKDIISAASLLFRENEASHVAALKEKSLDDFTTFKSELLQKKKTLSEKLLQIASETIQKIADAGLEDNHFNRSSFPKYLQKLQQGETNLSFDTAWQTNFSTSPLYTATTLKKSPEIAATIDGLTPYFVENFELSKKIIFQLKLISSILKNLTPLFVINLVAQEIKNINEEKNTLPISEFNALINTEIKDQPAPFIYERLGEKYRHFFIDEFQDTSQLQWENLIPLVENALSQQDLQQKTGSALLVGDAKQSIYRWRGGLPEQFMELYGATNPFPSVEKEVLNLETNYRSCETVINFNNDFFTFMADHFEDPIHKALYTSGNHQKTNAKKGGYVKLEFLEKQKKADQNEVYSQRIYETILDLKTRGFSEKDICILTRKKDDGIFIGSYLMEKEVRVISSETLLLQSSPFVQCLVAILRLSLFPDNDEAKINVLDFLHKHLSVTEAKHTFFTQFLGISTLEFEAKLKDFDVDFSFQALQSLSLYESCEYCVRSLHLQDKADAYLFSFMDVVFEFEQQPQATKLAFLETWEVQKDKASIPANEGTEAVQIMTIHKSKGLEFPVVIFPFATIDVYDGKRDSVWFPVPDELSKNFKETPINYSKELVNFGENGEHLYNEHHNTLALDNINLLYVSLTRAAEQLYVFTEFPSEKKSGGLSTYHDFFAAFLKQTGTWNPEQPFYEFGNAVRSLRPSEEETLTQTVPIFIATAPSDHHLKIVTRESALWDTDTQLAISEGNLLHDIMAEIASEEDITPVFEALKERSIYTSEELERIHKRVRAITSHPELKKLFSKGDDVKMERDIITKSGQLIRPDRLNFHSDTLVTIVDYKTGAPNYHHEDQINSYGHALEEMGMQLSEKIVVYTHEQEIVINKV